MSVAAVIVLSIIAALYLTGELPQRANAEENGLKFTMSLNATRISAGEAVAVNMDVYNTLERTNVVLNQSEWVNASFWSNICSIGGGMGPFGIVVLKGLYSMSNYSRGMPLQIFPMIPQSDFNYCNYYVRESNWLGSSAYSFDPLSDVAVLATTHQGVPIAIEIIVGPLTYKLPVGYYTIVGGDEWGSLTVTQFEITQT